MNRKELTAIVHRAIVHSHCSKSVEEFAVDLNKKPSTLYNELNPYCTTSAKLGLEDAHEIMRAVGSPDLVYAMAADLGLTVSHLPGPHSAESQPLTECTACKELNDVQIVLGQLSAKVRDGLAGDNYLDSRERADVLEACEALHREIADIKQAVSGSKVTTMKKVG
jgi:hypothetical protein